jgi:hypothetical protein
VSYVISHWIVAFLVDADPIIVTMNVYVGTLVASLPIENITTTIPSAKSVVVTGAPCFTMAHMHKLESFHFVHQYIHHHNLLHNNHIRGNVLDHQTSSDVMTQLKAVEEKSRPVIASNSLDLIPT